MIYWTFMHLLLMPTDPRQHVGCRCPGAKEGAMWSATIECGFQMLSWPTVIFFYYYYKQYVICYFHVQKKCCWLLGEQRTLDDPYLIVENILSGKISGWSDRCTWFIDHLSTYFPYMAWSLQMSWYQRGGVYPVTAMIRQSTVKPVYKDHPIGYFSAFWSSYRWPRAT